MTHLHAIARLLGGEVVRQSILFRAPGHSSRDRSASVRFDPRAPEGFVVNSFAGDDPMPIRDYVRNAIHSTFPRQVPLALDSLRPGPDQIERTKRALDLWEEAHHPKGTPVQIYLSRRGLELPDDAAGGAIRFHPSCPFSGKRTPAMVCLVRDVVTNEPKAIHRTALTSTGDKVEIAGHTRLSLGPIGGGAIKLTPDENVTVCLGIGEGIESALSLRNMPEYGLSPVWVLISAGGIKSLPVLPGVESLWIAVDHDQAGVTAAHSTAHRWRTSGAEVVLITSSARGADLNDLFNTGGPHA